MFYHGFKKICQIIVFILFTFIIVPNIQAECFIQHRGIILSAQSDATYGRAGYSSKIIDGVDGGFNTLYCIQGKGIFYNTDITGCIPIPYNTEYANVYKYHGYTELDFHDLNKGFAYTCRTYKSYADSPSNPNPKNISYGSSSSRRIKSTTRIIMIISGTFLLWAAVLIDNNNSLGCLLSIFSIILLIVGVISSL